MQRPTTKNLRLEDVYLFGEIAPVESREHICFITRLTEDLQKRILEKMDDTKKILEEESPSDTTGAVTLRADEQEIFRTPSLNRCFFSLEGEEQVEGVDQLDGKEHFGFGMYRFSLEELGYETRARRLRHQNQRCLFREMETREEGVPTKHPLEEEEYEYPFNGGLASVSVPTVKMDEERIWISAEVSGEHLTETGWDDWKRFETVPIGRQEIEMAGPHA
jgi:hypothetical protein